jgi:hypothetical protein
MMSSAPFNRLKPRISFLLLPLLCTLSAAQGQTRKPAPQTTALLVDTDDSCRLTVDDQDEGVLMPAQPKKINIGMGDHIVKCVIENIPDLVWRKVVEAKSSEQVAAMVALKAVHNQYDQAVALAQQQKDKAAEAKQQAAASEEKRKSDAVHLPEDLFAQLKGVWRLDAHYTGQEDPNVQGVASHEEEVLEFQSLEGGIIAGQLTWTHGVDGLDVEHRTVYTLALHASGASPVTDVRCFDSAAIYSKNMGSHKKGITHYPTGSCSSSAPLNQMNLQFQLLDANHLKLVPRLVPPDYGPQVYSR